MCGASDRHTRRCDHRSGRVNGSRDPSDFRSGIQRSGVWHIRVAIPTALEPTRHPDKATAACWNLLADGEVAGSSLEGRDSPTEVRGIMLLCDGAQSVGGKLYVLGGGWSILRQQPGTQPNIGLAIKLAIPWSQANQRFEVTAQLVTDDHEPVVVQGRRVEARGEVEVGHPPGLRPGTPLDVPLALNFNNVPLDPGGYTWELRVGEKLIDRQPFQVVEAA